MFLSQTSITYSDETEINFTSKRCTLKPLQLSRKRSLQTVSRMQAHSLISGYPQQGQELFQDVMVSLTNTVLSTTTLGPRIRGYDVDHSSKQSWLSAVPQGIRTSACSTKKIRREVFLEKKLDLAPSACFPDPGFAFISTSKGPAAGDFPTIGVSFSASQNTMGSGFNTWRSVCLKFHS